jgi:ADP-heptose:LPS heptosyltransferase
MVTARAARLRAQTGRRVQVIDGRVRPRWHPAWLGNPDIAREDEGGAFARLLDCGESRPYILAQTPQRWTWNYEHRASPGRIHLTREEEALAESRAGRIVLEPSLKPRKSPNKQWGWQRWSELARLMRAAGLRPTQLGPAGTRVLEGVEFIETADIRRAAAVIAVARAAVLPEGAMHHLAAAFRVPAVVIFGGYIDPCITGYDFHTNLFTGGRACGLRVPCRHCQQAMARIAPAQVFEALRTLAVTTPA